MLTPSADIGSAPAHRRPHRLWHDAVSNSPSLGCARCPERGVCGGLRIAASLYDCLDFCCGTPTTCARVCRHRDDYAARVREVAGFALENVPRAPILPTPELPGTIPVLFHGHCRQTPFDAPAVALSLYRMFDRRDGTPRYATRAALSAAFAVRPQTPLVLTGTAEDPPLERWWELGSSVRRRITATFRDLGVVLVTSPNYSLFSDVPRWTDLHAMKRIAITHQEFLAVGVAAALHVNGRTEHDFARWAAYVAARPEITCLAFEFATGARWKARRAHHTQWLTQLARSAGRPLSLVVRGGTDILPTLRAAFARVTTLDTGVFMKTVKRQHAVDRDGRTRWETCPTLPGTSLDLLLDENLATVMRARSRAEPASPEPTAWVPPSR